MRRFVVACGLLLVGVVPGLPAGAESPANWRDAVRLLAEEKTYAESGVGLLKAYVRDQAAVIEGRRLYDAARATSGGLIEQLIIDLAGDENPEHLAELTARIEEAVEKRIAFSEHVDASLPETSDNAKNVLVDALAKGAGEIIAALIDGGIKIWETVKQSDENRRNTIRERVQEQRWLTYSEIQP